MLTVAMGQSSSGGIAVYIMYVWLYKSCFHIMGSMMHSHNVSHVCCGSPGQFWVYADETHRVDTFHLLLLIWPALINNEHINGHISVL